MERPSENENRLVDLLFGRDSLRDEAPEDSSRKRAFAEAEAGDGGPENPEQVWIDRVRVFEAELKWDIAIL